MVERSQNGFPALKVEALHKIYAGTPKAAVDGISFEVPSGECFGLLGPNGAGKSTTIECLTGFYPPSRGQVLIQGINVHTNPKKARQWLGVCPQEDTLDSDFSLFDQLVRHGTFYRMPIEQCRKRAEEILRVFGLSEKANDDVFSLSGGMRRRLQVARALFTHPKVLILDEPTTGLDPEGRRVLWDILVQQRQQGLAILLSTHYMDEAERLCDRIAIMNQGKILDIDTPQNLIRRHVGEKEIEEEIRPGVRIQRQPNLEDVFLLLAGNRLIS